MKRVFFVLIIITLLFSGCSDNKIRTDLPTEITFSETEEDGLEVKSMYFAENGAFIFENVGYADEEGFHLDKPRKNGQYLEYGGKYNYKPTQNYKTDVENAKGILLYKGLCYAVKEEENKDYLILISDNTFEDHHPKYEIADFMNKAADFYNEYGSSTSGGNGLLYPNEVVSG